jgi:alcohol-forming fatty acyl-CoA reductase
MLPPYSDWKEAIRIAENTDEDVLNVLTPKFINFMPNTYTFSKNLSEQCIKEYEDKLPLVIFRPSIVISTMKDPIAGWMDNFNGPVGLLVGCGIGLTRTLYCSPDNIADFIPVDVAIKAMIIAVWKRKR